MFNKEYLFEISNQIREYILENSIPYIKIDPRESTTYPEKIFFNSTESPIFHTKGMLLLLHKKRFNLNDITGLEKDIAHLLTFECNLKKEFFDIKKIQEKFQDYTGTQLRAKYANRVVEVDIKHMNEYDWKVDNIQIEVKTDCWMNTGNISLELLRDYNDKRPTNIGSVLKTKSVFWQDYFYDKRTLKCSSEVYLAKQLQDETDKALEIVKNRLGLDVDISNF